MLVLRVETFIGFKWFIHDPALLSSHVCLGVLGGLFGMSTVQEHT